MTERVERARSRLQESKAGRILWRSIEAHGGLRTWFENGPLRFQYDYKPVGDGTRRNTVQTVDQWSAKVRHRVADAPDREFGWTGDVAWYRPPDWEPDYDVRFWALTPYYFVGMPFVLADPGVQLEYEGEASLEGSPHRVIRATFGEVGISPDDFYVLYIDNETHELSALRYIVSYPKYFPDGGHSPEKLMTYDGRRTVDGILFAKSYRFFMWKPERRTDADVVTRAELSDVEFRPELEASYFAPPEDAARVEEPDEKTSAE